MLYLFFIGGDIMTNKYQQIYNTIREGILSGEYPVNSKLPDEITLAKQYKCSRMTIKKALELLVNEGLIYRHQGKGTFVLSHVAKQNKIVVPERDIKGLSLISSDVYNNVSSQILNFSLEFATDEIAQKLQVSSNAPIYNISRLRLFGQTPCVLEQTYMSTSLIPGITLDILNRSIYDYIENTLNLKIVSASKLLRADISNEKDQKYLNLSANEPIFEVEQVAYLDNGQPFEYSISRHRYDLFEFSSFSFKQ